jgi:uncharacterized membrane protein
MFIPFVACGIVANLLIKTGLAEVNVSLLSKGGIVSMISSPRIVGGILCYGVGLLSYFYLLRKYPLNVVQPFSAVAFVGVIIASYFVLGEPIPNVRWLGVGFITAGIILVGRGI